MRLLPHIPKVTRSSAGADIVSSMGQKVCLKLTLHLFPLCTKGRGINYRVFAAEVAGSVTGCQIDKGFILADNINCSVSATTVLYTECYREGAIRYIYY